MAKKFLAGLNTTAIQIGTSATSGYVLTTDSSGNGTWQSGPTYLAPRVATLTVSTSTYTPNAGTTDVALITSPTAAFTIAAPSGTPVNGQKLLLRILSGTTAYTPTWNSAYLSSGIATLPSTLVASKTVTCGFVYDTANSKWVLMAVDATGY